jgi:uncharacterized DUF497 family protein
MFLWDAQKATTNLEKHGISFEEAALVFGDPEALDWDDPTHSNTEQRFKRLGTVGKGRVVLVVYTLRETKNGKEKVRIISARQANRKERHAYAR